MRSPVPAQGPRQFGRIPQCKSRDAINNTAKNPVKSVRKVTKIDEDTAGSNDKTFYDCVLAHNYHMDRNKAVYVTLTNGGGNRGMVHGYFADDAGLDSTKIALASGIVFLGQQAAGMVNGSGF